MQRTQMLRLEEVQGLPSARCKLQQSIVQTMVLCCSVDMLHAAFWIRALCTTMLKNSLDASGAIVEMGAEAGQHSSEQSAVRQSLSCRHKRWKLDTCSVIVQKRKPMGKIPQKRNLERSCLKMGRQERRKSLGPSRRPAGHSSCSRLPLETSGPSSRQQVRE